MAAPTVPRASSERWDAEQAPLSHLVQLVKANRWVQRGHVVTTSRGPVRSSACHFDVARWEAASRGSP